MEFEKDNPDVLGSLYTLRGGLSAISAEYDKARRLDGEYHERLNTIADQAGGARYEAPHGTVEYAGWLQNGGFESELQKRLNSISYNYTEDNREKEYLDYARISRKSAVKWFVLMSLFLLLIPAFFVGMYFFCYFLRFNFEDLSVLQIFTSLITYYCIFPIAVFIVAMIFMGKGIKAIRLYKKNKQVSDAAKELNILQRQDAWYTKESAQKTAQANLDKLPWVRENAQKLLNNRNGEIMPLVQSCNVFYRVLQEQFNPLLDERDWQHLDLVIYEIETRRADSIKEALQLIDRELQTERIERTIGEATKAICYTLARGFSALQDSIKICCNKICDRLDTISSQLDTLSLQMTVQSMQLAGISSRLADLTDSVNVNNALQAKANISSAQLYNEVQAMRRYC